MNNISLISPWDPEVVLRQKLHELVRLYREPLTSHVNE